MFDVDDRRTDVQGDAIAQQHHFVTMAVLAFGRLDARIAPTWYLIRADSPREIHTFDSLGTFCQFACRFPTPIANDYRSIRRDSGARDQRSGLHHECRWETVREMGMKVISDYIKYRSQFLPAVKWAEVSG
ncbi:MAG: hypothetical protein WB992_19290 [Bryobacteraceae bacterium]